MAPDEQQAFLRSRRSVRRFLPKPVPREILQSILETATWAPSAHNRQPWRFIVLESAQSRQDLAAHMGDDFLRSLLGDGLPVEEANQRVERSRCRIIEAPVVIMLCLDTDTLDMYPDAGRQRYEYLMAVQSAALAGGNLLLAAHAEGLGGVWVCAPLFAPGTVRKAIGLPAAWDPQGMLLLGYPAALPEPRPRRPLAEVVVYR